MFAGCSSGVPLNSPTIEGGPGEPITVEVVGVDNASMPVDAQGSRNYVIHVEVSNNSRQPETVRQITVDQTAGDYALVLDRAVGQFDETIDPGKDHEFTVTVTGRAASSVRAQASNRIGFRVIVTLANRDSYGYAFEGPVR